MNFVARGGGGGCSVAAAAMALSGGNSLDIVSTELVEIRRFLVDRRYLKKAQNGRAEIAQPGGQPITERRGRVSGGSGPSRRRGKLVNGLITSQYPIVPAWRIDRRRSKLVYVSMPIRCHI